MKEAHTKWPRILAIAPGTRGFGYAVFEGQDTLVDWGIKSVTGNKNTRCLEEIAAMIAHYQPGVLVLENILTKDSKRCVRVRTLTKKIAALASSRKVHSVFFSRNHIQQIFFADGKGTKHALAEMVANRFPEELGFRLPPKRQPWMSQDCRMDIFDAVALGLMIRLQKKMGK